MYDINQSLMRTGWVCPKCKRIMAPTMVECIYCNKDIGSIKQSNTAKTITNMAHNDSNITTEYPGDISIKVFKKENKDEDKDGDELIKEVTEKWLNEESTKEQLDTIDYLVDEFLKALGYKDEDEDEKRS